MEISEIQPIAQRLTKNIAKVIIGKEDVIRRVLISLFASGHVLLEDMPGTGKTTLAKALAKSIDAVCTRVQFTPDLLPSDLTGVNFFSQKEVDFVFKQGPIFTNILLADEINRATPRTQSSLLECMEEGQITVDSTTHILDKPFFVIATQNPIETQGTFPLPEAQLDRFFMKLSMGYPAREFEIGMLGRFVTTNPVDTLEPVITREQVVEAQAAVRNVQVSDAVKGYIIDLVEATRQEESIRMGASPRGAIAVMRGAQVSAAFDGRTFANPDDVKSVVPYVLSHRILCRSTSALRSGDTNSKIISDILGRVPVPTE